MQVGFWNWINSDKHTIQQYMDKLVVESPSELADKLLPLNLEEENQLQKKVAYLLLEIKESKNNVQQLQTEHGKVENSIKMLSCQMSELDKRKTDVLNETKLLHQRIDERNWGDAVQDMIRMLKIVKDLERKESDLLSSCKLIHADVEESFTYGGQLEFAEFDEALSQSMEKLTSAKREFAAKLRAILSVKRKIGDVPTQVELIQYERRFSELYSQIQEKHRQTSKYYDTYNALLEIKELMLKETSLLNSINSQLQDALTSSIGSSKLVDSMEVIVKGAQQKLEKVQLRLLAEKKHSDFLREKYTAAIADQRHFSLLLKAFQDECTKNERLSQLVQNRMSSSASL
ncbi:uncharacterized protein LOC103973059 isoform X5 [Musa acuminata AAA Group]|uniref:uncharacterized protein LOC103973059 isoform X5 n=1 Tax=Musa acuminata AAA Group TaxID=214697 RepID=UPI0031DC34C6